MIKLTLTDAQKAALECAGLETPDGPQETALALAWQGGNTLVFDAKDQDDIYAALNDLSNGEDAFAEDANQDTELRKFARRAARSLGTMASRVLRAKETK